jgi:hypothetical protein
MTEFSLEPVTEPGPRPRCYAWRFSDQHEFVNHVYDKAMRAMSKGKPIPQVLFADEAQSVEFHRIVMRRLTQVRRRKDQPEATIESDVLKDFRRQSIPSSARIAPARWPRFYASPFNDQREFFTYVYHKALHAMSKGKPMPQLLFADEAQSAEFHRTVMERLKHVRRRKDRPDATIESDVLKDFRRQSIPSSARTDLADVENACVDIFGHGKPAQYDLATGTEFKTMPWVEKMLKRFGLSSIGEISLSVCYGAAGQYYKGTEAEWLKHFEEDTLPSLYNTDISLGATLHDRLRKKYGYTGTVRAGLTVLSLLPVEFHPKNRMPEMHYAAVPQIRGSDRKDKEIARLRKRHLMLTFGDEDV